MQAGTDPHSRPNRNHQHLLAISNTPIGEFKSWAIRAGKKPGRVREGGRHSWGAHMSLALPPHEIHIKGNTPALDA